MSQESLWSKKTVSADGKTVELTLAEDFPEERLPELELAVKTLQKQMSEELRLDVTLKTTRIGNDIDFHFSLKTRSWFRRTFASLSSRLEELQDYLDELSDDKGEKRKLRPRFVREANGILKFFLVEFVRSIISNTVGLLVKAKSH